MMGNHMDKKMDSERDIGTYGAYRVFVDAWIHTM